MNLNVDSGLHDFLSEDTEIAALAAANGVLLRDVRKTPPRSQMHFFSGKINEVDSLKVALLGTDSAVGKRTTAWLLVDALEAAGISAELVGTGQTAWMQGARHSIILDSLINDFVAGEIEHAVCSAWRERRPRVIVIEGQGSLMNPAYPADSRSWLPDARTWLSCSTRRLASSTTASPATRCTPCRNRSRPSR